MIVLKRGPMPLKVELRSFNPRDLKDQRLGSITKERTSPITQSWLERNTTGTSTFAGLISM